MVDAEEDEKNEEEEKINILDHQPSLMWCEVAA